MCDPGTAIRVQCCLFLSRSVTEPRTRQIEQGAAALVSIGSVRSCGQGLRDAAREIAGRQLTLSLGEAPTSRHDKPNALGRI